jgi:hypothetical protein
VNDRPAREVRAMARSVIDTMISTRLKPARGDVARRTRTRRRRRERTKGMNGMVM